MGLLIEGEWHDQWYDTASTGGHFVRSESQFRDRITTDGSGSGGFKAESARYHLYVSLACPWAHRALIFRQIKQLSDHLSVSVVNPFMLENGWTFDSSFPGATTDHLFGFKFLYEVYLKAAPRYTGRVTVPVLWDKQQNTIVSNESADIIRMFNSAFNELTGDEQDFYPAELREEIDEMNAYVYANINNGVYKSGFATTQRAYEEAVIPLFNALDELDARLASQSYLLGERLTEADWRAFTTLVRFDPVYVGHFKCNLRRIYDYPNLYGYLKRLYNHPGVKETVDFEHIKTHYYGSHKTINPTGIIPRGPVLDLNCD